MTVSVTTEKETTIDVNLIDVNGKLLKKVSQQVPKRHFQNHYTRASTIAGRRIPGRNYR